MLPWIRNNLGTISLTSGVASAGIGATMCFFGYPAILIVFFGITATISLSSGSMYLGGELARIDQTELTAIQIGENAERLSLIESMTVKDQRVKNNAADLDNNIQAELDLKVINASMQTLKQKNDGLEKKLSMMQAEIDRNNIAQERHNSNLYQKINKLESNRGSFTDITIPKISSNSIASTPETLSHPNISTSVDTSNHSTNISSEMPRPSRKPTRNGTPSNNGMFSTSPIQPAANDADNVNPRSNVKELIAKFEK